MDNLLPEELRQCSIGELSVRFLEELDRVMTTGTDAEREVALRHKDRLPHLLELARKHLSREIRQAATPT